MQQVIIDCNSGKVSYIELSSSEEAKRLQEVKQEEERQEIEKQAELKRRLVRELAELREMKLNPTLFTASDITEKQAEIDRLQNSRGAKGPP